VLKTSIGCVAREETRNNVQPQAHFAMISVHVIDRAMPEPERELGALLEHLSFAPHDKEQTEDIPGCWEYGKSVVEYESTYEAGRLGLRQAWSKLWRLSRDLPPETL
jgi:hypothetical protein